ncbi:hypothetical protein FAIPA1_580003 [Frankia sp. AiPs1]|uniref:hypothetical protein n=1 Tax=Frankia sp. AiPa1 TaxID=573492 RepID=UPI00202B7125|nr:hypothetical protein [Frankia sp. AiPa1]MCL9759248.1 hypothetical protein [Frankia sp. AiPa1]
MARATELYLKTSGKFEFVLPLATLSRRQFAGFRTGKWSTPSDSVVAAFDAAWNLHAVKPSFFPVPACVLFGHRAPVDPKPLATSAQSWSGRLADRGQIVGADRGDPVGDRGIGEAGEQVRERADVLGKRVEFGRQARTAHGPARSLCALR